MRYNVTIQAIDPKANGMNMNVIVEANNVLHAIDLAGPKLAAIIAASGLQVQPVPADPTPAQLVTVLEEPPNTPELYIAPGHEGPPPPVADSPQQT